ncbi:unnamed protein product [Durusdinium trenchii]|uniref:Uncharacterized protein n=1 Tax=Durusdinium trenchii TaxID=1381693 RepID=A0ABP0IQV1_9DINO
MEHLGVAELLRRRGTGELSRDDFFRCLQDLKANTPTTRSSEGLELPASPARPSTPSCVRGEGRPWSSPGSRSSSSFAARNELWDLQRSRRLERMREKRDQQELRECSFQPFRGGGAEASTSLSPSSQAAFWQRLATSRSPGYRVCQRLEAWKAERDWELRGECTFNPDTSRSSRSFQQLRPGMTARTPERRKASSVSELDPSFTPSTNPVPARMRSAQAYLQQSVFRRLSQPTTPRRATPASFASSPRLSRCRSEPGLSEGDRSTANESLLRFLQRQNLCEEARQERMERLEASVAPPLRPVLCERSLQLAARGRTRTPSPRRATPAEKEMRFKPRITSLARQHDFRGFDQLGPLDQRRREERARRRLEEKFRKEAKQSAHFFKPVVNSYQNIGSRIKVLEEPDTYLERVSRTRERALQVIRNQCKEDFSFKPKVLEQVRKQVPEQVLKQVQPAPSLVQRMARSHRALREMREKENRSKASSRPAWQSSTLLE